MLKLLQEALDIKLVDFEDDGLSHKIRSPFLDDRV